MKKETTKQINKQINNCEQTQSSKQAKNKHNTHTHIVHKL